MKASYYNNSHLCAECTGAGCRRCIGGLSGTGNETFPLSLSINNAKPPYIKRTVSTYIMYYRQKSRLN